MKQIYDYMKEILETLGIKELTEEKEQELYDFIFKQAYWQAICDDYDDIIMDYTEMIENAQGIMQDEYAEEDLNEIGFDEAKKILEDYGYEFYLLV